MAISCCVVTLIEMTNTVSDDNTYCMGCHPHPPQGSKNSIVQYTKGQQEMLYVDKILRQSHNEGVSRRRRPWKERERNGRSRGTGDHSQLWQLPSTVVEDSSRILYSRRKKNLTSIAVFLAAGKLRVAGCGGEGCNRK